MQPPPNRKHLRAVVPCIIGLAITFGLVAYSPQLYRAFGRLPPSVACRSRTARSLQSAYRHAGSRCQKAIVH